MARHRRSSDPLAHPQKNRFIANLVDRAVAQALEGYHQFIDRLDRDDLAEAFRDFGLSSKSSTASAFESGFRTAAAVFWDDLVYARQRRRGAVKGSRANVTARLYQTKRRAAAVVEAARAYRQRWPDVSIRSTRAMALHISKNLTRTPGDSPERGLSFGAVRNILLSRGIR